MGPISETSATLRFFGDDLDPAEITRLLGVQPSASSRKGELRRTPSGAERIARQGSWRLSVGRRTPGNLDLQLFELLAPLTSDLAVWRDLSRRYGGNVFCGVFVEGWNQGVSLRPDTMSMLGDRCLELQLDIYADEGEPVLDLPEETGPAG